MKYKLTLIVLFSLLAILANKDIHTVIKGDTLWDISATHRGDPFKWPDIWQLNPQIENPHLIYPGDEVTLGKTSKPAGNGDSLSSSPGSRVQKNSLDKLKKTSGVQSSPGNSKSTKTGDFAKYLHPEILLKAPYIAHIDKIKQIEDKKTKIHYQTTTGETILQPYSEISINQGLSSGVKKNDLFIICEITKKMRSFSKKEKLGKLIEIKGLAKVKSVEKNKSFAVLEHCFGAISHKARALPFSPHPSIAVKGYTPYTDKNIVGQIIHIQGEQKTTLPYNYIIIDKGAATGFKAGDGVV
ncbi:MAG: LysM peptidoglycan-binding domain-containing protein, partial [Fibrobacteria bacterium]|nr:LysM peptidoglycan-binding domain-containing protein [Fibrobacteria bacterium]